jgi:hypothetical protein
MSHTLGDQKENKKKLHILVKNKKDAHIQMWLGKGPNGRCSKDLMSKPKPKPLGGEWAKEEIEKPRKPFEGRT